MKIEGKALSVFSFIFAAGTAAGMFLTAARKSPNLYISVSGAFFYLSILSASISAGCAFFLKNKISFRGKEIASAMLAAAFFCSGIYGAAGYRAFESDWKKRDTGKENDAGTFLQQTSSALKRSIDTIPYMENSSNALVKALLTGDKSDLDDSLKESFRKSGASHLLALSGMHLGIIYLIISRLLSLAGNRPSVKKFTAAISVCAAGFYTLMTGAGPSIVRAFLFICVNEAAKCLYRKSNPANTFGTALLLQLTFSPESIMSAGFQLSYLAMAGIYFLYPRIKDWYGSIILITGKRQSTLPQARLDPMQRLWNTAALSISCQAFTAPAAWIHFRSFPLYFLITNIIAVPITTVAIQLAILVTVLHSINSCPVFLTRLSEQIISLLIFCIRIIGG